MTESSTAKATRRKTSSKAHFIMPTVRRRRLSTLEKHDHHNRREDKAGNAERDDTDCLTAHAHVVAGDRRQQERRQHRGEERKQEIGKALHAAWTCPEKLYPEQEMCLRRTRSPGGEDMVGVAGSVNAV
jgi:hypothetical protein